MTGRRSSPTAIHALSLNVRTVWRQRRSRAEWLLADRMAGPVRFERNGARPKA